MHCDRARDLVGAYVDGELTGAERDAIADHIHGCATCSRLADDVRGLGQQITNAGRETASVALAARIRAALAQPVVAIDRGVARPRSLVAPRWRPGHTAQLTALAASCVLSAGLTWAVMTGLGAQPRLDADVVAAHIRSLLQDSPIQVASSDSHTVRPWFTGRIDFSPDVKDLTGDGFPLVGGRLDYIGDRRVSALVYKRRLHVVNVFMWPAATAEPTAPHRQLMKGYNVLHWNKNGVTFWAVSDLNLDELRQLQSLL